MVRTYHRTTTKGADQGTTYSRETLEMAVADVKNGNKTQRAAAKFYSVPRSTLRHYMDGSRGSGCISKDGTGGGGKLAIPPENELQLADCLRILEKWGFGLSREEVMDLVQEFVQQNNLKTRFKDGRPGPDWFIAFKKRHNLSIKMPQGVEYVRLSQENPFVINGLFDLLEKTIDENGLTNKPHLIFNCDESGFGHDPSKTKVVGGKGVKCTRTISSAGRENTTVLVSCSAAGGKLPLLCVFKGKNIMESWIDKESDARTGYAATKSGWMDSEIFYNWFQKVFIPNIPQERPIILILDGHKSHVSLPLILKAVEHQIILFKLPPHTTHITQPLDVGVFKGLKSDWDKNLTKWQRKNPRKRIPKQEFVNILVSSFLEVNEQNVKNAFKASGLYDEQTGKPNRQEAIKRCKFKPHEIEAYNVKSQQKNSNTINDPENQANTEVPVCVDIANSTNAPLDTEKNDTGNQANTEVLVCVDIANSTNAPPDTEKNDTENQANTEVLVCVDIANSTNAPPDTEKNDTENQTNTEFLACVDIDNSTNAPPDTEKNDTENQTNTEFLACVDIDNSTNAPPDTEKNDTENQANTEVLVCVDIDNSTNAPPDSMQVISGNVKRSFEDIIVQMFHRNKSGEDSSKEPPKPKRKKISSGAEIITASEYIQQKLEDKRKEDLALQQKNKKIEEKLLKKQREQEERLNEKGKKTDKTQKLSKSKKKNFQQTDFKINTLDIEKPSGSGLCQSKNTPVFESKSLDTDSDDDTSDTAMSVHDSESDDVVSGLTVVKGDFVIVLYNETKYPGQVVEIKGDQVQIKHMKSAGLTNWRWPEEEDILRYEEEDILKLIRPPIPMNKRGVFRVPELKGCYFEYE